MTLKRKSLDIDNFEIGERVIKLKPTRWPIHWKTKKGRKIPVEWRTDIAFYSEPYEKENLIYLYKGIHDGEIHILSSNGYKSFDKFSGLLYKVPYDTYKHDWAKYVDQKLLSFLKNRPYVENFLRHPNYDQFRKEWKEYTDPKIIHYLDSHGLSNKKSIDEFLENFE